MNVTINCDASFSKKHQVGSYAFWIVSNLGRMTMQGPFRRVCKDSTEAEMKCIINALTFMTQHKGLMDKAKVIHVNTDSMNAIHVFELDKPKIKMYRLKKYLHLRVAYMTVMKKMPGKKIFFAHVKAHTDITDKRSYVNDWLDKAAKSELGKMIEKELKHIKNEKI